MTTGAAGAQAPEPADQGKSPGAMLRQRREQRGLSLQDVADELHLDRRVIETIEADRFVALGAPVYARGHLRKYAQLLDIAPDTVLASYDSLSEGTRVAEPEIAVPAAVPARADRNISMWIALGALAACVAALAIWKVAEPPSPDVRSAAPSVAAPSSPPDVPPGVESGPAPAPVVQESPEAPPPAAAITRQPDQTQEPDLAQETAAPVEAQVASEPAAAPGPMVPQASTISAGAEQVELLLDFLEPSWVEVYDAAGGKLMFDIGQPGRPRKLSGSAPLTVLLGKADAVQVTADGQPVVVPRRAGRDAARFTVAAGGAVR